MLLNQRKAKSAIDLNEAIYEYKNDIASTSSGILKASKSELHLNRPLKRVRWSFDPVTFEERRARSARAVSNMNLVPKSVLVDDFTVVKRFLRRKEYNALKLRMIIKCSKFSQLTAKQFYDILIFIVHLFFPGHFDPPCARRCETFDHQKNLRTRILALAKYLDFDSRLTASSLITPTMGNAARTHLALLRFLCDVATEKERQE